MSSRIQKWMIGVSMNRVWLIGCDFDGTNIEWDYNYYQPWSDNEWLVDEMLALLDKDITMQ